MTMHASHCAFHERPPLPALSPARSGGEGGRRPGEGRRFLVPMRAKNGVRATHEPERGRVRSTSRSTLEDSNALRLGLRPQPRTACALRLMVPMRGANAVESSHGTTLMATRSTGLLSQTDTGRARGGVARCERTWRMWRSLVQGRPRFVLFSALFKVFCRDTSVWSANRDKWCREMPPAGQHHRKSTCWSRSKLRCAWPAT